MRHAIPVLLLLFAGSCCQAQTFEEWFKQKETRKKYLIQQIAAFKVYLGYVQKGYSIAQKGITTISNIKKENFNLHRDYFDYLKDVNPKVSRYAKVADIITLQVQIVQVYKDSYKQVRTSNLFNPGEVNYIFTFFANLLNSCSTVIAELIAVVSPDELGLKDDERIKRIDALYKTMQENYTFAQGFASEAKLLAVQRMKEKKDVQRSRIFNGIKNEQP